MLRALTSQDLLWGSNTPEKPSFFEAENDFVRRSSGKKEEDEVGGRFPRPPAFPPPPPPPEEGLKIALRAAAAEEVGFRLEEAEDEELGSSTARRSQRHKGQKPVKCSCGWRSQEVEGRCGCSSCCCCNNGGGAAATEESVVGFITENGD